MPPDSPEAAVTRFLLANPQAFPIPDLAVHIVAHLRAAGFDITKQETTNAG